MLNYEVSKSKHLRNPNQKARINIPNLRTMDLNIYLYISRAIFSDSDPGSIVPSPFHDGLVGNGVISICQVFG